MSLFPSSTNFSQFPESLLLAWLTSRVNLNQSRLELILSRYSGLAQALEDNFNQLRELAKVEWLARLPQGEAGKDLQKFRENLEANQISVCTWLDAEYPSKFTILNQPPLVLYYQGDWGLVQNTQTLTVVGSRNLVVYAKQLISKILEPVCQLGVGVVSGLAYGVDTLAHQAAVTRQAPTIGVIGSGLDRSSFYPQENWPLSRQILDQGGLVVSEYSPGTAPSNYHFPRRNQLLAALSELSWIVQAGLKSGSLITATAAEELGKTVATTPATIYDTDFGGNLELLKNGANLISEPEDILQLLGLNTYPKINPQPNPTFGNDEERLVWQSLSLQPQLVEALAAKLQMDIQKLSSLLTMLELQNLAICTGENRWVRG